MLDLNNTSDVYILLLPFFVNIKGLPYRANNNYTSPSTGISVKVNGIMFFFSICPYSYWLSENQIIYMEYFNN